jgi:hypothetical protein
VCCNETIFRGQLHYSFLISSLFACTDLLLILSVFFLQERKFSRSAPEFSLWQQFIWISINVALHREFDNITQKFFFVISRKHQQRGLNHISHWSSRIMFLKEWHFYAGRRRFRIPPAKYNRREGEKKKEACFAVNSIPDFFIRKT